MNRLESKALLSAIKPLGRSQSLESGLGCDHSATGFEICGIFDGDIEIELYTTKEKDGCDAVYFTVYIDGERLPDRYSAKIGEQTLRITLPNDKTAHVLRVVKQTESNYNLCEIAETN